MIFLNKVFLGIVIIIITSDQLSGQDDSSQSFINFEGTTTTTKYGSRCDSNPCKDFGICAENFREAGDYFCHCKNGYIPQNSTYCADYDECSARYTCGDFPCKNERGWYRCICGSSFAGVNCTIARYSSEIQPTFNSLSQVQVILAGGTRVTVKGEDMNIFPILGIILTAFYDNTIELYVPVMQDLAISTSFDFIIPQAPSSKFLNLELVVNVLYYANDANLTSKDYINTGLTIKYVENPVLDSIFPSILLADGGVTIYGNGSGFDVIKEIRLLVDVLIMDLNGRHLYSQYYSENCTADENQSGKLLKCIWPNLNLSSEILPELDRPRQGQLSRKTRQAGWRFGRPISSQIQDNRTVNTYMGLIFDGFQKYEKLGNAKPNIVLTLTFKNPVFEALNDLIILKELEQLKIQGKDVDVGVTIVDYNVMLSAGDCIVTEISANLIQCLPPAAKPQQIDKLNNTCYKWPGSLPVHILLGRKTAKYFIGCADYGLTFWSTTVILAIVAGSCFLVLVVLIAVCCVCCFKGRNMSKKGSPSVVNYSAPHNPGYSRNIFEYDKNLTDDSGYKTPHFVGFNNPNQNANGKKDLQAKNKEEYMKSNPLKSEVMDDDLYLTELKAKKTSNDVNRGNPAGYLPMNKNNIYE